MKNHLITVLTIAGLAIVVQSCKKEDLSTLNTPNNNISEEHPQSQSIQNNNNSAAYKTVDLKDLAAAMTPQNYPLDSFQLLVQTDAVPTADTTNPKIRRGIVVAPGKGVSVENYPVGTNISYNYAYALPVYISGNFYHVIFENMIIEELTTE